MARFGGAIPIETTGHLKKRVGIVTFKNCFVIRPEMHQIPLLKKQIAFMRNLLILSLVLFFSAAVTAQISEQQYQMSKGSNNAITFLIPDANEKLISNVWREFAKDDFKGKAKYQRRDKEYLIEGADLVGIGKGNSVDLYSQAVEQGKDVLFKLWIDLGDSFLSGTDHPGRYESTEDLLMRFGLEVQRAKVRLEIEDQEKVLITFEKDLKKLEKENEGYHKDIEKAQEAIREAELSIEKNKEEQVLTQERIEEQKEVVEQVKEKLRKI